MLGSFPGHHWIYWLGPAFGALIAVGFYRLVKLLEYETANPGQDFDEKEDANFQFDEDNARGADVWRPDSQIDRTPSQANGSEMRPGTGNGNAPRMQAPPSRGRPDGVHAPGNTDGPPLDTLDPKMHPGYPNNLAYQSGPDAETGNAGGSIRR